MPKGLSISVTLTGRKWQGEGFMGNQVVANLSAGATLWHLTAAVSGSSGQRHVAVLRGHPGLTKARVPVGIARTCCCLTVLQDALHPSRWCHEMLQDPAWRAA